MTTLPLASFLAAWAFLAMNVATPGPNVLNTIATAIGSGRRAALGAALGTGLGVMLWCLGMVLGVAALLTAVPVARGIMTLIAAALLLWFASRYLRKAAVGFRLRRQGSIPAPSHEDATKGRRMRDGLLGALTIIATNPKALTTWLTLTTLFPVALAQPADIAILCLGSCVVSAGIHAVYALGFSTQTAARAYLNAAPVINLGVGLFFGGFALLLAVSLAT